MRSYVVLVLAAGCAATRAAAPDVPAPHVEPVPQVVQPTFQPEVSPPAPHVDVSDPSHQISDDDRAELTAHLAHGVAREARGYAITATIARVNVTPGRVACSVSIRIAPDEDGAERWETDRTAIARGSAVATGGKDMIRACLVETVDEVIARHVLPFLRRRSSLIAE